jgi:hypothetical protein
VPLNVTAGTMFLPLASGVINCIVLH